MPIDATMIYLMAGLGPILLGIAILVSLWLLPDLAGPWRSDVVRMMLQIVGWSSIVIGLVAIPAVGLSNVPGFVILIAMILLFTTVVAAIAIYQRHRAWQQALLWTMAVATARKMPLEPVIEAFAAERGGRFGARALLLARYLRAGWKLPDALGQLGGLVTKEALMRIRTGSAAGDLAQGLRQAVDAGSFHEQLWNEVAGRVAYFAAVVVFAVGMVVFLSISILPAMQMIARDFGVELPRLTRWMAIFSGWLAVPLGLVLPLCLAILLYAVLRYAGWVQADPPGLERLLRRGDTATILDTLTLATRRQRPLPEAIAALAKHYPKRAIRSRLTQVLDDIQAGGDWADSLARRGLIAEFDVAVLEAAQRVGNLPWAMTELADSSRRRLGYRFQGMIQLLFPACILALGLVVAAVVIGYFLPVIALIQAASAM